MAKLTITGKPYLNPILHMYLEAAWALAGCSFLDFFKKTASDVSYFRELEISSKILEPVKRESLTYIVH